MARQHAIATPPGEPTKYVDFTPEEEAERDAEEAQWAAEKPAKDARRARLELKGSPAAQMELMQKIGPDAWKAQMDQIDRDNPIPGFPDE